MREVEKPDPQRGRKADAPRIGSRCSCLLGSCTTLRGLVCVHVLQHLMDRECFLKRFLCSQQSALNWSGQYKSSKQSIAMAKRGVDTSRVKHTVCIFKGFLCVCASVLNCVCSSVRVSLSVRVCVCLREFCVSHHHPHIHKQKI